MKRSKESIEKRWLFLLKMFQNNPSRLYTVEELSAASGVSLATIRRDLRKLEEENLIQRERGGATALPADVLKKNWSKNRKELLARRAASYIQNDDVIFINSSSTALGVIQYIPSNLYVTICTNNANAIKIPYTFNIRMILTGGETKQPKSAMTGEYALNNLEHTKATKTILGISGIDFQGGLTSADIDEVKINQQMLSPQYTGEKILVAESTKIGHIDSFVTGKINDVDLFITDQDIQEEDKAAFEKEGVRLDIVPDSFPKFLV